MPFLVDIKRTNSQNTYNQDQVFSHLSHLWKMDRGQKDQVESIFKHVQVSKRNLAIPLEQYTGELKFSQKNTLFIKHATDLVFKGIQQILKDNDLEAKDIDALWNNTVTGFSIPSLDARVANLLDFPENVTRVPILGLGCMGGVSGLNRTMEYLKAFPEKCAIFFCVELCSLTINLEDFDLKNIISMALFGDGAGVVLLCGDEHPLKTKAKMQWCGSESHFYQDTLDMMGWQLGEDGLEVILDKAVPELVAEKIPTRLDSFIKKNNIKRDDVVNYHIHPGGPKVLQAFEEILGDSSRELKESWESLRDNGNLSSVSVLDIMQRKIKNTNYMKDDYSIAMALGPGFSSEFGLYKWL